MSETVSYIRTALAGFVRVTLAFAGYQVYKFTDFGPGVPFYEYRNKLLDYQQFSKKDIDDWIAKNYNREVLLDPSLSRTELWPIFFQECHLNIGVFTASLILGALAGRKSWEIHMNRFIRGKKGYHTIKFSRSEGPFKNNGANNQVYSYSQTPYRQYWEDYGYLKECTFRVPLNLYLHDLIVDIKKAIEVDEGDSIIPDITIKGFMTVNISDPQKASSVFLNIEDSDQMGLKASEYISQVIMQKVRENKLLVKYMQEDPEEYIKYLNKYLKQLLKQNIGIEVLNSDVIVENKSKNEEEKQETFYT